ncbi:proton-conducting transporter membrane subunit, partial [Burkholderia gladioli]|nr:proton-conducting transporter membrane subunit [Burkholderia gladioli]
LSFITVIGAITALFMGFLGVIQNDIKRVVAYSTLSQLGYMTVALGVSAYPVAVFHLMTHAFFKALLFLAAAFDRAVELLAATDAIWLAGVRRSFPVVAYLDYALQHTGKRIQLVSGLGGMQAGQLRSLREGEVLLAVSFAPYAQETQKIVEDALQRGAKLIAITDSRLNALASGADVALLLQESDTFGFRSLTSTMGLAQSLFIALAYRLELAYEPAPAIQKD